MAQGRGDFGGPGQLTLGALLSAIFWRTLTRLGSSSRGLLRRLALPRSALKNRRMLDSDVRIFKFKMTDRCLNNRLRRQMSDAKPPYRQTVRATWQESPHRGGATASHRMRYFHARLG